MTSESLESQVIKTRFQIRGYDFEKLGETSKEPNDNTDNQDLYSSKEYQGIPSDSLKSQ